ncbi:BrnT family toxin [Sulfobacillus acidophilus]|uniref:BrnT family toxin n=1 Tax=Sulfobacillus acidophilus TaxID=53633 RepID=A0ABS3AWC1_9FIRM|nr:BrnT family toxin [Sulfobacillus acidophilus]
MAKMQFEWDENKNKPNQKKHKISFGYAQLAFLDPKRIIAEDEKHSQTEKRYYCFGKVDNGIITVRFTLRKSKIRIIGAGYWRKGKQIYEKENNKIY